jgi:hypothetical protein
MIKQHNMVTFFGAQASNLEHNDVKSLGLKIFLEKLSNFEIF